MKTSRSAVQIRGDDADVVFETRHDCSNTKCSIVRKCSSQLRVTALISAVALKFKLRFCLDARKGSSPAVGAALVGADSPQSFGSAV